MTRKLAYLRSVQLFAPDNLSAKEPTFVAAEAAQLRPLILRHFKIEAVSVEQYAGKNVTAQNFRVHTADDSVFFLKMKRDITTLRRELELNRHFFEDGQKVPELVGSVEEEGVGWALFRFLDGEYFSGTMDELVGAIGAFAELSFSAHKIHDADFAEADPDADANELRKLLHHSITDDEHLKSLTGQHATMIVKAAERLAPFKEDDPLLMHLDFNPLNVLFRNGSVAGVVDFEAFGRAPVEVGLGFACYKFARQYVCSTARDRWRSETFLKMTERWNELFPNRAATLDQLRRGAARRALFLIYKILRGTLVDGDARFAYDLEKQIRSLIEIDFLFSRPVG